MGERVCVCKKECMGEWVRERECVCVCVCKCVRESVCVNGQERVCMCVKGRQREIEYVHV